MNYAEIKKVDIANGPGVRVSLFVSGCRNHCKGCFNPETWDFDYGRPFTRETEDEIIEALRPSWIQGLSILGGEPTEEENAAVLIPFLKRVRAVLPDKDIWLYSGYTSRISSQMIFTPSLGLISKLITTSNCISLVSVSR